MSFKSRWTVNVDGNDSFVIGEPSSLVIDAKY